MVRSSEDGRHGTGHPRTALPAEEGMPETTVMPASGAASSADAPSQRTLLLDETAPEHATGLVIRKKKPALSRLIPDAGAFCLFFEKKSRAEPLPSVSAPEQHDAQKKKTFPGERTGGTRLQHF